MGGLSELRVWLDDREGAKTALERALKADTVVERFRMARSCGCGAGGPHRYGDGFGSSVAERDREGSRIERAERMLRCVVPRCGDRDADRASLLAEVRWSCARRAMRSGAPLR